jgi:hypothetical protein
MESGGIGWRELVMLAAALAGVYLVIALMALARLRRRPAPAANVEPTAPADPTPVGAAPPVRQTWEHPFLTPVQFPDDPASAAMPDEPPTLTNVDLVLDESPAPIAPAPQTSSFAATLAVTELESELRQLRDEVAQLRQELAELKEARRISPLYADAAALAHRGFDARGVAEECGISVAEAELVLAMSKDEKNFDSEVEDGADGRQQDAKG